MPGPNTKYDKAQVFGLGTDGQDETIQWDQDAGTVDKVQLMEQSKPKFKASVSGSTEGASSYNRPQAKPGMAGTSTAASRQRAMTPEEMSAMADMMMAQMAMQGAAGEGQVQRRFAGAAQRDGNALRDGAAPAGDKWLDEYMASQR
jgi:hypothetical protein